MDAPDDRRAAGAEEVFVITPLGPPEAVAVEEAHGYDDNQPASLALRSDPASVRLARRFVHRWLGSMASTRLGEDLQLVTSELVTNAIRHSLLSGLRLSRDGDCVVLEVDDGGRGEPVVAAHLAPNAPTGRGLLIVERLVNRWGWTRLPDGGKRVWCELCPPAGRS